MLTAGMIKSPSFSRSKSSTTTTNSLFLTAAMASSTVESSKGALGGLAEEEGPEETGTPARSWEAEERAADAEERAEEAADVTAAVAMVAGEEGEGEVEKVEVEADESQPVEDRKGKRAEGDEKLLAWFSIYEKRKARYGDKVGRRGRMGTGERGRGDEYARWRKKKKKKKETTTTARSGSLRR
jgi:hypothetical protein